MKTLLSNWTFMRALRLLLGIAAAVQAFLQKDPLIGLLAGFLLITALANIGCCGSTGCAIDPRKIKRP
jgi:hypothetical protein